MAPLGHGTAEDKAESPSRLRARRKGRRVAARARECLVLTHLDNYLRPLFEPMRGNVRYPPLELAVESLSINDSR